MCPPAEAGGTTRLPYRAHGARSARHARGWPRPTGWCGASPRCWRSSPGLPLEQCSCPGRTSPATHGHRCVYPAHHRCLCCTSGLKGDVKRCASMKEASSITSVTAFLPVAPMTACAASCLANGILTLRSVPDDRKPDARPPAWDGGHRYARAVVAPHAPPCVQRDAGRANPSGAWSAAPPLSPSL